MKQSIAPSEAGRTYAAAHAAHYTTQDLAGAMALYQDILERHSESEEAGYARTQIYNLLRAVVPSREIVDGEIALVLAHLATRGEPPRLSPVEA